MSTASRQQRSPWPGLLALMIGFFMILVDSTIVSVAIPSISRGLSASVNDVVWVNSAYLLAYAVPLLITGRLGDRYGPRTMYLSGLVLFTLASLACGLAPSIGLLIVARVVQGLGGALMTPQTMAIMIRTFPAARRGAAMGVWGGVAGLATITGPLLGGLIVDAAGWQWIFFVNVPVGVVGFVLAWLLVPRLEVTAHTFDWLGVALSASGMFALVFGIQEGDRFDWDWRSLGLIAVGVVLLGLFVLWQRRMRGEPLVPLALFADRNFSLACLGVSTIGFSVSTFAIPYMLYTQSVQGFSPTHSALLLLPMGVISGVLSPLVGRVLNHRDPKPIAIAGMTLVAVGTGLLALCLDPDVSSLWILGASCVLGVGNSMMWGPMSMIATRNLEPRVAGAGSSVYNTVRQVGAVIGSACIAAMMTAQLTRQFGQGANSGGMTGSGTMPPAMHDKFAQAMSTSLLLPAGIGLVGALIGLGFARTRSWQADEPEGHRSDTAGAADASENPTGAES